MNEYEIIAPYDINNYIKKGYEFVAVYTEPLMTQETYYNSSTFVNEYKNVYTQYPKFLVRLTPAAKVLHGSK